MSEEELSAAIDANGAALKAAKDADHEKGDAPFDDALAALTQSKEDFLSAKGKPHASDQSKKAKKLRKTAESAAKAAAAGGGGGGGGGGRGGGAQAAAAAQVPDSELTPEELAKRKAKEAKKAKKAVEKAAKEAKKEANRAARGVSQGAAVPELAYADLARAEGCAQYGNLGVNRSQAATGRSFTRIEQLTAEMATQHVWVRGRVFTSRSQGKSTFLVLRQSSNSVQTCLFVGESTPKEMVKFAGDIAAESIVDMYCVVNKPEAPVASCTQQDVELAVERLYVVSRSMPTVFSVKDASQSEEEMRVSGVSGPGQDTRLENRVLDLRTPANQAILRAQSAIGTLFREGLTREGFTEIHTPKIIPGASEGGADVFKLNYFGDTACLAQSPQLYKQMGVMTDLERVFEIGPVFRAEKSETHRHLCEFMGLDMEMAFVDHYHEVLEVFDRLFTHIFHELETTYAHLGAAINAQYPKPVLRYSTPQLRLQYHEAVAMLHADGVEIGDYDDLSTAQERRLGELVAEKYEVDFFMLDKFPAAVRPFYTMLDPTDPNYSNSYDFMLRGEEIMSGAQRVHDAGMLTARATEFGVPLETIKDYIECFKLGSFPHAGGGVGLERVVMLYYGLDNIRKTSMFPRTPTRMTP